MRSRRELLVSRLTRCLCVIGVLSALPAGARAGGDALTCNEPLSAIPTADGTCTAMISFTVTNDGCGDFGCEPGLTQNGGTFTATVGPGAYLYSCTSEESEDGNPDCACFANVLVEDQERPKVGTPGAIDACFFSTTDAVNAAKEKVMAVATDNCGVTEIKLKLSEIDLTCRFVFSLVAVDAEGNESTPPTTFQTTVNGDGGTITCKPTKETYEVDEDCEATIVFTADIEDECCVDLTSIRPSVVVTSSENVQTMFDASLDCVVEYASEPGADDDAVTAGDNLPPPVVDRRRAHVTCAVKASSLTSCPATITFEVDAKDCCGNLIDDSTCRTSAKVVDKIKPELTCPPPITVDRGDKLCGNEIDEWLSSVEAEDNCGERVRHTIFNGALLDLSIPDNDPNGVSHKFDLTGSPNLLDLDLDLTIDHPNVADLTVKLRHAATDVSLIQNPGPPGCEAGNYFNIVLNDGAAPSIQDQCEENLTTAPTYRPANPLAAFDGHDFTGEWTITVIDSVAGGEGKLQRWSLSGTTGLLVENDAPELGLPVGTTTVTFKATDGCGNMSSCKSDITVSSPRRGAPDQKGSLLVFSKIEMKWDADGKLIQDTLLDVSNDADEGGVDVQAYFINGDRELEELTDRSGNLIQEFEPGWNTADCRFHLTKNQPHFWSAAKGSNKCQSFTVLDPDGPGRLDADAGDGSRILRGFVVMWAVRFHDPQLHNGIHSFGENGFWEEIRWNHLKGDAVVINYALGSAWEYSAVAYQARCGDTGESLLDCTLRKEPDGLCIRGEVIPGVLDLDGFQYDTNFDELLLDFYASGSTGLSSIDTTVMVDTDLTLHSLDIDLRQDGIGPILTKAEFEIFNQNESKFSGTRRCICCWDQTLLSNYVRDESVPNHFLRTQLRTDKGYARIDGVRSTECDYFETCGIHARPIFGVTAGIMNGFSPSFDTPLTGLAFKILTFSGAKSNTEWAGGNLHGTGEQPSTIRHDVPTGSGEAHGATSKSSRDGSVR